MGHPDSLAGAAQSAGVAVTVVIPAHNEQECIAECVTEVTRVLKQVPGRHEVIVVDDGSSDGTGGILAGLQKSMPLLRVLRLAQRSGQTAAFDAGFRASRGRFVVTMDADLQNDPADIPRLLEVLADWDVVCGIRAKRRDPLPRRVSSRIANAVRNWALGDDIRDVGCSLRALRGECLQGLKLYEGMHRFLPTLLKWDGWRVTQVPVNHRPRQSGRSKYGIRNRLFGGLRDLLAVRWMRSRRLRYEVTEKTR